MSSNGQGDTPYKPPKKGSLEYRLDQLAKKDPQMWFDMVTFRYYVAGDNGLPIPVEWGRARFDVFARERERSVSPITGVAKDIEIEDLKSKIINALQAFDLSPDDLNKYHKNDFWHICEQALLEYSQREVLKELERLSVEVVEPCEPDCDEVRHALHQGTWNAHLKIDERIKELEAALKNRGSDG